MNTYGARAHTHICVYTYWFLSSWILAAWNCSLRSEVLPVRILNYEIAQKDKPFFGLVPFISTSYMLSSF